MDYINNLTINLFVYSINKQCVLFIFMQFYFINILYYIAILTLFLY